MHRSVFAFVAVALLGAAAPSIEAQTGLPADTTTVKELTAYFAGQWSCAGEFANHKPIASDVRFESALDGAFVRYTHADRPPNGFKAQAMWGRGASPGEVLSVMQDNFGNTRVFRSPGSPGQHSFIRECRPCLRTRRFTSASATASKIRIAIAWNTGRAAMEAPGDWVIGSSAIGACEGGDVTGTRNWPG